MIRFMSFAALAALAAGQPALAQSAAAPVPAVAAPDDIARPGPVNISLAGSGPDIVRYLKADAPFQGVLSPDGNVLSYLSSVTGEPQIWSVPVSGGQPRQLTFGSGVNGFGVLADGSYIYFADHDGNERVGTYILSPDGAKERAVLPATDQFVYPGGLIADESVMVYSVAQKTSPVFELWSIPLAGGTPAKLADGRRGFYASAGDHAGKLMLMTEATGEATRNLYLRDLATGAERVISKPAKASINSPVAFTPDDGAVIYLSNEDREFPGIARFDIATGQRTWLVTADADIPNANLSRDGKWLAYSVRRGGLDTMMVRDMATGKTREVTGLPTGIKWSQFARGNSSRMIAQVNAPTTPGEIWLIDPATGTGRRLTEANLAGIDRTLLAAPEAVSFKARDGLPLGGLLYMPAGAARTGAKPPVFIRLHGGPSGQAAGAWAAQVQYLVARGIAVLDFDYRGSTGRGRTMLAANDKFEHAKEKLDIIDAVNWLKASGRFTNRFGIGGISYGGYLTNAMLTSYPGVFAAGVSEVGVADWVRNLKNASPSLKASDLYEYGDIDDPKVRAFYEDLSPMKRAAAVRDPFMVQTGANDPRNGADEQDAFVAAIRAAGGKVVYRRYPDEGHVMSKIANIVDFGRARGDFLVRYLRPGEP